VPLANTLHSKEAQTFSLFIRYRVGTANPSKFHHILHRQITNPITCRRRARPIRKPTLISPILLLSSLPELGRHPYYVFKTLREQWAYLQAARNQSFEVESRQL
jgi:hypothetical protein